MNDLLAHLLARSFRSELRDAVQPRLPARFERARASLTEPTSFPDTARQTLSPLTCAPLVPPNAPAPPLTTTLPPNAPAPPPATTLPPNAPAPPPTTTPPGALPALPARLLPPADSQASLPAQLPAASPAQPAMADAPIEPAQNGPRATGRVIPSASDTPAEAAQPVTDSLAISPTPKLNSERHSGGESPIAPPPPASGSAPMSATAPGALPVTVSSNSPTPVVSARQETELPPRAPRITISIGRIEIRAIPAPPPSAQPRSRTPAPALSLDDYLSRRNGGRR